MRILFCNDSYPGCFETLASIFASKPGNKVLFLSSYTRRNFSLPGVSRVLLRVNRDRNLEEKEPDAFYHEWKKAFNTWKQAYHTLCRLRESGFIPDIILVASANGPALFLRRVFPESFIVSYLELHKRVVESVEEYNRRQAELCIQSLQLDQSDLYFVFSEWQKKLFPRILLPVIHTMPLFVDTDFFSPQAGETPLLPGSEPELVSFNLKGVSLKYGRTLWPEILELMSRRPQCRIVLSVEERAIRKDWGDTLATLPGPLRKHILLTSFLKITEYRDLLRVSTVHICPEYMEPPLHEMLECMSCGTLLMAPAIDSPLFQNGKNMLALPESGNGTLCRSLSHILDHMVEFTPVRRQGRQDVLASYSTTAVLPGHVKYLMETFRKIKGNNEKTASLAMSDNF